jgi:hypothetical protein
MELGGGLKEKRETGLPVGRFVLMDQRDIERLFDVLRADREKV